MDGITALAVTNVLSAIIGVMAIFCLLSFLPWVRSRRWGMVILCLFTIGDATEYSRVAIGGFTGWDIGAGTWVQTAPKVIVVITWAIVGWLILTGRFWREGGQRWIK